MKRALFSVYDKQGVEKLAAFLAGKGYEIISTGGTFQYLQEHGIPVQEIGGLTGFPEILGGRVKTLQPQIHGGILADRSKPAHLQDLQEHDIIPIDYVVVTLYPFEEYISRGAEHSEIIEKIDIGGVTLLRAAAKNYRHVSVLVDSADFETVMQEEQSQGGVTPETRRMLAAKAFSHTAYYDSLISTYFNRLTGRDFPSEGSIPLRRAEELRYGENPHQPAALYRSYVDDNISILNADVLWGKQLSYNNVMDADAALDIVREFSGRSDRAFVAILKHSNPCGAALGDSLSSAYDKALAGDPVSAFGGILATNTRMERDTAAKIIERFFEIIIAPDYEPEALELLQTKKNLRILRLKKSGWEKQGLYVRRIESGILMQKWDVTALEAFEVKTKAVPTTEQEQDLVFAWKICKHVKSNAIVYARNGQVLGVGAGQMSRVDSARFGALKARDAGFDLQGAVLASDAFFPFRDGIDAAAREGVQAIIQPGGSVRDDETIGAADEQGVAMVFTGVRHFKH